MRKSKIEAILVTLVLLTTTVAGIVMISDYSSTLSNQRYIVQLEQIQNYTTLP
jgi:cell division protein FtsL